VGRVQFLGSAMWAVLLVMAAMLAVGLAAYSVPARWAQGFYTAGLSLAAYVALPLVLLRLTVRRFHDLGKPGWLAVLLLVPMLNLALYAVLLLAPGQAGRNRFGEPPAPASTASLLGAVTMPVVLLLAFVLGQPVVPSNPETSMQPVAPADLPSAGPSPLVEYSNGG
jgi:uncharacterized membrane protein YhaH (DUF805 family)